MAPRLVVRADADEHAGTGHVMRAWALAQGWMERGGAATLATCRCPARLLDALQEDGVSVAWLSAAPGTVEDARETGKVCADARARWVVLDGYGFPPDHAAALSAAGVAVLKVDDVGSPAGPVDALLNPNPGADPAQYPDVAPSTRLLLGPAYVPLRREFRRSAGRKTALREEASRVLVTFGGSDPAGLTGVAVEALRRLDRPVEAAIVVGAANARAAQIEAAVAGSGLQARVLPPSRDMAALMAWADVAVSAVGTTAFELAFMGVPSVQVVAADNQRRAGRALEKAGASRCLGDAEGVDAAGLARALDALLGDARARQAMSESGRRLVDGRGLERIVDVMLAREGDKAVSA